MSIAIIPASELKAGDIFSTDGYVVTNIVKLPKTKRVFVQCELDGWKKQAALAEDFACPLWTPDVI